MYKFWKFDVEDSVSDENIKANDTDNDTIPIFTPGEIVEVSGDRLVVACGINGEERISVIEIQAPGKKRMNVGDFLRGNKISKGMKFV